MSVRSQLEGFRQRLDTFSLGVCNGCQLMALLNWVGPAVSKPSETQDMDTSGTIVHPTLFTHNTSGRCEGKMITKLLFDICSCTIPQVAMNRDLWLSG